MSAHAYAPSGIISCKLPGTSKLASNIVSSAHSYNVKSLRANRLQKPRYALSRPLISCSAASLTERVGELEPSSPPPLWQTALKLVAVSAVCCSLAAAMQSSGPFASLSLAAGGATSEGMKTAIRSAWAGLAAGCLHTLAGADHLAALTPLTIGRSHLKASLLGALWGFGHSTGQLILGLLMIVLKDRFQQLVPALSKWGGTTVGLTLLAIGAMGLFESVFEGEHEVAESGALERLEIQEGGTIAAKQEKQGFGLATFATGIIYGLQPDALFVIIPALALPTKLAASAYILMFVLGTVAAMGAYTGVIGATSAAIKRTNTGLTRNLSAIASIVAIAIGVGVLLSGWGFTVPWFSGGH